MKSGLTRQSIQSMDGAPVRRALGRALAAMAPRQRPSGSGRPRPDVARAQSNRTGVAESMRAETSRCGELPAPDSATVGAQFQHLH